MNQGNFAREMTRQRRQVHKVVAAVAALALAACAVGHVALAQNSNRGGDQPLTEAQAHDAQNNKTANPAAVAGSNAPQPITKTGSFDLTLPLPPASEISGMKRSLLARYGSRISVDGAKDPWPTDSSDQACAFYVPQAYMPGQKPYGLIIRIPQAGDAAVFANWRQELDDHHIIFIGLQNLPSRLPSPWRTFVAICAAHAAEQRLTLDPDRIYVTGDGKGAMTASETAMIAPDVFNGGIFFGEANPGFAPGMDSSIAAMGRGNLRIVLQIPKQSAYLDAVMKNRAIFEQEGYQHCSMAQTDSGSIGQMGDDLGKMIDDLDAPLIAAAEEQYKQAQAFEKSRQLGQALADYSKAAMHGGSQPFVADADQKSTALQQQFDQDVAKVQSLIAARKLNDAADAIQRLASMWNPVAKEKVADLLHQLSDARK